MATKRPDSATIDGVSGTGWQAPSGSKWRLEVTWATTDGRAEPVRLVIQTVRSDSDWMVGKQVEPYPDEPMTAITATDLRAFPLASFLRGERDAFSSMSSPLAKVFDRRKGKRITDEELRQVAAIYREAWSLGGNPTDAVAEQMNMARSTAAKRVMAARAAGHLPPASPGKASA